MTTPLTVEQLRPRLEQLTLIDVRSPGEYASGHIPGALNIPLDRLDDALTALREAAARGELAVTCASGPRATTACERLTAAGIPAVSIVGGTGAWASAGHPLNRLEGARTVWAMDRQVRLVAGSLVLAAVLADIVRPGARWLAAAVGGGLVFSALSDTCAMGNLLGRLPHNRPRPGAPTLDDTLATLRR
ncbi:rhodanese-like domain-containing protein [Streptomyces sp. SP17BM10]|uniref:rhodanese-like domain-containing protein n=1 Tax=Streptomyces sp. SP17BM10 TaxID=3002530 RepID=UPI002E773A11|nr:rhodanese-like domain-containing protein [Streptomyces sp. SP17BM10]MEE1783141.1 rhodanese-like domain-containing protein [Streptomyces sp. SP17BM10]